LHITDTAVFGAGTTAAVRSFQSRHGCAVSGHMDPATWRALLKATH
jgi:peptidoglycan hydrolase-like protein with peptidoglycan-binding domain